MKYKYTKSQTHQKVDNQHALDKMTSQIMDNIQLFKWKVTLGASVRAKITCPMHDTRISQIDNDIPVIKRFKAI